MTINLLCMSRQCMGFELPEAHVLMKSTGIFILQLHDYFSPSRYEKCGLATRLLSACVRASSVTSVTVCLCAGFGCHIFNCQLVCGLRLSHL